MSAVHQRNYKEFKERELKVKPTKTALIISILLISFFFYRDVLAFQSEVEKKEEEYRQEQYEIVRKWATETLPRCFGGSDTCILPAVHGPVPRGIFIDIMKENGYDASIDLNGFGRIFPRIIIKKMDTENE